VGAVQLRRRAATPALRAAAGLGLVLAGGGVCDDPPLPCFGYSYSKIALRGPDRTRPDQTRVSDKVRGSGPVEPV